MMKIYKWNERYTIEEREGWMKILCKWEMELAQGPSSQKNETLLCTVCVKKLRIKAMCVEKMRKA